MATTRNKVLEVSTINPSRLKLAKIGRAHV